MKMKPITFVAILTFMAFLVIFVAACTNSGNAFKKVVRPAPTDAVASQTPADTTTGCYVFQSAVTTTLTGRLYSGEQVDVQCRYCTSTSYEFSSNWISPSQVPAGCWAHPYKTLFCQVQLAADYVPAPSEFRCTVVGDESWIQAIGNGSVGDDGNDCPNMIRQNNPSPCIIVSTTPGSVGGGDTGGYGDYGGSGDSYCQYDGPSYSGYWHCYQRYASFIPETTIGNTPPPGGMPGTILLALTIIALLAGAALSYAPRRTPA